MSKKGKQKFQLEIELNYYDETWTEEDVKTMYEVGTLIEEAPLISVKEIK